MKELTYIEVICKDLCKYYKEGKEDLSCGAYDFLKKHFTLGELRKLRESVGKLPDLSKDHIIENLVCKECPFVKEDCDFRAGLPAPPCGGYVLIEALLKGVVPLH